MQKSKIKIAHIFKKFPMSGQPYNIELLRNLSKSNFDQIVISMSHPECLKISKSYSIYDASISNNIVKRYIQYVIGIAKQIYFSKNLCSFFKIFKNIISNRRTINIVGVLKEYDPDIIHVHHLQIVPTIRYVLDEIGKPWVVSLRGYDINVRPIIDAKWKKNLMWIFKNCSGIHSVSLYLKERALKLGAIESKIVVIPLFYYKCKSDQIKKQTSKTGINIASVGRLNWEKGTIYGIETLKVLIDMGLEVKYHIFGDGPLKPLIFYRALELGVDKNILCYGHLPEQHIFEKMQNVDILLHPSVSEALSQAIINAQGMGLPVVASNVGGIPEVVEHGKTGILVAVGEIDKYASAIIEICKDSNKKVSMSSNAQKRINSFFNKNKIINEYCIFYKNRIDTN